MQRPTSVTVFGFINIAFGLLGIVGQMFTMYFSARANAGEVNYLSFEGTWADVSQVVNFLATFVLLATGFGLLAMKPWARKLSVGYAVVVILMTIIDTCYFLVLMFPELRGQLDELNGGSSNAMIMMVLFPMAIGLGISLLHPGLLWYFMTRPHVVAAFAGDVPPAPVSTVEHHAPPQPFSDNPYASPAPVPQTFGDTSSGQPQPASEEMIETLIPVKNQSALAAYYLGLFSLFPVLGLPLAIAAVILGRKGLAKVRSQPEVRGTAHAWVGLICGTLFGGFNLVLICLAGLALARM